MTVDDPVVAQIVAFLERIGIPVAIESIPEDSFLPGVIIRRGAVVFDPKRLPYPGDLLHEAGHIAVTDPTVRSTLEQVADDPAEEMSAIAWSYAAAIEIGIDPTIVFHDDGYKGGGAYLIPALRDGDGPGVPMLAYYGMTVGRRSAAERGVSPYPDMTRWLR